jgi:TIGR03009 family protein
MRYPWLSLMLLFAGGTWALAQQPPGQVGQPFPPGQVGQQQPPGQLGQQQLPGQFGQQPPIQLGQQQPNPLVQQPGPDSVNNKLDAVLLNWERAMSGINSLHAEVEQTAVDHVFKSTKVLSGVAIFSRPNKALLYLKNAAKPQEIERLMCNGQTAYKWDPAVKEIHVFQMPQPKQGQINDDNFTSMFFGMKAADAKRRYDLQLANPPNDAHYYYIWAFPRDPQDKAEFTKARIAITIQTHLPREIHYEQPNGNTTKWFFPRTWVNQPVDPNTFAEPKLDPGWKLKKVPLPQGPPPRIIRPQDGK